MVKKNMFIVIKRADVYKYLSYPEIESLHNILDTIRDGRINDDKNPVNSYHVCNVDEPYASVVHSIISSGEFEKRNPESETSCKYACGSGHY